MQARLSWAQMPKGSTLGVARRTATLTVQRSLAQTNVLHCIDE